MKKKITYKELATFLRSKTCNTPFVAYLAKELFENENHSITEIDENDFRLRDIFDHIIIENDTATDKTNTSS